MRFLLTLITFLTFYMSSSAAPISEGVAREKAARFIASKKGESSAARSAQRNGGSASYGASLTAVDNQEAYYVFNVDSSNGYVIVSGDDRMPDVLGYSYSGSYNRDSIPDNMKAWLQGYADEYQYLQSHSDAKAASLTSVTGDAILPMIPTHWSQNYPYNALCPVIQGQSALTGCVATAMSQVMYYHQWPKQTSKKIPAYTTKSSIKMDAIDANTAIDWDNMSPTYGYYGATETMNKAVANIMLLTGCSVKMEYGLGGSGAPVAYMKDALQNYFDYKNTITYIQRESYTGTQDSWNQMIYDELKNERPVIYGGQKVIDAEHTAGHAFIIDGYDQDDYFHVNWGWGHSDGYFQLNAFDVEHAYTTNQEVVIGIEGKGNPEHKYAYAVLDDDVLTFCYDNERETRTGTMFNVNSFDWTGEDYNNQITTVKFEESFADYPFLTTMRMMFADMPNLTTIEGLTNLNTQNVTDMYALFYNCPRLESLDLSNFDTKNVTDMSSMFYGCLTLNSLNLSSFDTRNVTNMAYMFTSCSTLDSLNLSSFDTQNVTNMYGMFAACNTLDTLDLSSFDTRNVTNMAYMFTGCQNVEKIYVDEKWTTENVQSSDYMFNGCWKLVGQDGTEYDYYKEEDATYAHYKEDGYLSCWPKAYAVLENDTLTFYYDILKPERTGTVLNVDKFEWTGETYRNDIATVTFDAAFGDYHGLTSTATMFSRMENLTTIDGLEYLNTENVTDMSAMFSGCQSLDSLDLRYFDTKNVTDMSWMFGICQSLTSLDLGNFDTDNVTKMNAMFSGCENLEALNIAGFNTENVTKMNNMFTGCKQLTALNVSNFDTRRVEDMSSMFSGCQKLDTIDVTMFNTENVTKMNGLFSGCNTLDTLDLSKFNTKSVTRMDNMFKECFKLTTIYVGDDWNTENVTNSKEMFLDCSAIVGQDGTTYDEESTDKAKAHYDEGGYLTYKPLYLRGDANGDGTIDKEDVKFVSDIILGVQKKEYYFKSADANGDGVINMPDIMFIVNYILNGKFPEPEE